MPPAFCVAHGCALPILGRGIGQNFSRRFDQLRGRDMRGASHHRLKDVDAFGQSSTRFGHSPPLWRAALPHPLDDFRSTCNPRLPGRSSRGMPGGIRHQPVPGIGDPSVAVLRSYLAAVRRVFQGMQFVSPPRGESFRDPFAPSPTGCMIVPPVSSALTDRGSRLAALKPRSTPGPSRLNENWLR